MVLRLDTTNLFTITVDPTFLTRHLLSAVRQWDLLPLEFDCSTNLYGCWGVTGCTDRALPPTARLTAV